MKGNGGALDSTQYERLVAIMTLLAGGDRAALFTLYEEFGESIAVVVRRELRRVNVRGITADDFSGLVIDATITVGACASGWDPAGGAPPWIWARHRIRQLVARYVGQYADSIDSGSKPTTEAFERYAASTPLSAHDSGITEIDALIRLSASDDQCALLLAALEDATNERDREILLAYKLQTALGDPSPANTVGAAFHLKPATVRQVVKRALVRLRALASSEPRYRPLLELHFLNGGLPTTRTA